MPTARSILRALIKRKLEACGYRVQAFDETDQIIRDRTSVGLEVPVQVALARQDPKILTAWLGVDGILHAELLAFNRAQLAIYTRREVKARFWLTDRENKTLWEGNQDSDSGTFGGGSASLADAVSHLVDETFSTFPRLQ